MAALGPADDVGDGSSVSGEMENEVAAGVTSNELPEGGGASEVST